MAKLLVRGLVLGFILNALVMEQGEVGVTGSDEKDDDDSVFEHIVAANEATRKLYESQASAADTKSEIASNLKEESLKFYQGDIVLDAETYNLIKSSKSSREKRNAIRRKSALWTSRIIPYHLPPKMWHIRTNLQIAISELQQKTCLRFVPYSGRERNYIYFDNNRGCSSMIGKYYVAPGKQTISIAGGCKSSATILHELLHAIGFWHEQSRPDRDKYVRVNYENIPSSERDQFDSYSWQTIDDLGKSYDFQSIMHYGNKAFTINRKPTIEAIHDPNLKLGSQDGHLSTKDVIEINALYDCDTSSHGWTEWSSFTPCDKNCRKSRQRYCYHPRNDYSQCIGANPYGIHQQVVDCSQCPVPIDGHWGNWGQWTPCSATCDDGGRKRSRQCNNPYPAHGGKQCEGLAEEDALCMVKRCLLDKDDTDFEYNRMGIWYNRPDDSFDWQLLKGPTETIDTGPFYDHTSGRGTYLYTESSAPRLKGDTAKLSTRWMPYVPGGQCVKFAYHMFGKTTGTLWLRVDLQGQNSPYYIFHAKGSQKKDWLTAMGNIDLPTSVAGYRLTFEAVLGGTGYSDIAIDDVYIDPGLCDCQDDYVSCKKWASKRECSKNADWMAKHCKRSCKKCVQATIAASLTLKPTKPFCSDNDPVQCPLWANRGECTINPVYMNKNCADSCAICDCKDSNPVQCPLWAAKGICKRNPAYMLVKCIKSCNVCRCHDKNVGCMQWAARGECAKNPLFMKPNCRRSCNICK